jgi:hypothetical protein
MRPPSPLPFAITLAVLSLACAKPRFTYAVSPSFPLAAYRTVALDPRTDRVFVRDGYRPLDPALHRRAVLAELAAKRYQPAPPEEADLWLNIVVLMRASPERMRERPAKGGGSRDGSGGSHRGGGRGGGAHPGGVEDDGPRGAGMGSPGRVLVIVQLRDRKTGLTVWQGEAETGAGERTPGGAPPSLEADLHQLLLPLAART